MVRSYRKWNCSRKDECLNRFEVLFLPSELVECSYEIDTVECSDCSSSLFQYNLMKCNKYLQCDRY